MTKRELGWSSSGPFEVEEECYERAEARVKDYRQTQCNKKYHTSQDTGRDYSIEYTVRGLPNIVIQSHCEASGRPKTGANTSHCKSTKAKLLPGTSYVISPALAAQFIDFEEARREKITKE